MREIGAFVPRYADRESIEEELDEARALMRRIGCIVIRTDNRAVEESAQEIIRYLDGAVVTED
jgi:[pyruvate, water dikinase]-phosphate phosphotransferase / [pyruvate, water dikinase] kinase